MQLLGSSIFHRTNIYSTVATRASDKINSYRLHLVTLPTILNRISFLNSDRLVSNLMCINTFQWLYISTLYKDRNQRFWCLGWKLVKLFISNNVNLFLMSWICFLIHIWCYCLFHFSLLTKYSCCISPCKL